MRLTAPVRPRWSVSGDVRPHVCASCDDATQVVQSGLSEHQSLDVQSREGSRTSPERSLGSARHDVVCT